MQELALEKLVKDIESGKIQKSLILSEKELTDEQIIRIVRALRSNNKLQILKLQFNEIRAAGVRAIAGMLQENTSLQELILNSNNIGDSGTQSIAAALSSNSSLQELSLNGNDIGDSGAQFLAVALSSNSSLQRLNLGGNNIMDSGAIAIAAMLRRNGTLQILQLYGNKIEKTGFQAFHTMLQSNSSLQALDLSYNKEIATNLQKEIGQLILNNCKRVITRRNHFIETLIILARDHANPESTSSLAVLPKEIKLHILSLISFTSRDSIGKTSKQINECARFIFEHFQKNDAKLSHSNCFQVKEYVEKPLASEGRFKFLFFKGPEKVVSPKETTLDWEKLVNEALPSYLGLNSKEGVNFYHTGLTVETAAIALQGKASGSFILRPSQQPSKLGLSVVGLTGEIRHIRLAYEQARFRDTQGNLYPTLLDYFQANAALFQQPLRAATSFAKLTTLAFP